MSSQELDRILGIVVPSYLVDLKSKAFTGEVLFQSSAGQNWRLYFYLGRIMYATGGKHPVRRWQRHILAVCPTLQGDKIKTALKQVAPHHDICWEYTQLREWTQQGFIAGDKVLQIVKGVVHEVLFDIISLGQLQYSLTTKTAVGDQLVLLDPLQLSGELRHQIQQWQQAKLLPYSPDQAPIIQNAEQLQAQTSGNLYQTLKQLLNGQRTLRDLARSMNRSVIEVTTSLAPFLKSGVIRLLDIEDLVGPSPATKPTNTKKQPALIACIDDSTWVVQALEKLITGVGYRFMAIQDPLRAIPALLTQKPDLILLDLRMPNTNGYELCSQLRRLSQFQNTPILILTGNDGIVDRVRAKISGANDFLSKSVDNDSLLATLDRYLDPNAQALNSVQLSAHTA